MHRRAPKSKFTKISEASHLVLLLDLYTFDQDEWPSMRHGRVDELAYTQKKQKNEIAHREETHDLHIRYIDYSIHTHVNTGSARGESQSRTFTVYISTTHT